MHRHVASNSQTEPPHVTLDPQQKPKDISPASKLALRYLDLPADVTKDGGEKFREGLWLTRMYSGQSSEEDSSLTNSGHSSGETN